MPVREPDGMDHFFEQSNYALPNLTNHDLDSSDCSPNQGLVLLNVLDLMAVQTRPSRNVCAFYVIAVPVGAPLSMSLLEGG